MSQLIITKPTLAHKEAILTFRREFNAVFDELHGANELNSFTDGGFVGWLTYINAPSGTQWFEYEKVADSTYIALLGETVVGIMNVRHHLTEFLLNYGGHIGYSTHPDYQGQGIATAMLGFGVQELKNLGVDKVLVTCADDNVASAQVIVKNGGVLDNVVMVGNKKVRRYWVG